MHLVEFDHAEEESLFLQNRMEKCLASKCQKAIKSLAMIDSSRKLNIEHGFSIAKKSVV